MKKVAAHVALVARELLKKFRLTGNDSYRQEALYYKRLLKHLGFQERWGKYGWDDPTSAYVRYGKKS